MRQIERHDGPDVDIEKTDELPSLDLAAYEARIAAGEPDRQAPEPDTVWDESRSPHLPGTPSAETLRYIETWIETQNARARADEHALADARAARAAADARAGGLEAALEVERSALQTALARANSGERSALENAAAAHAAESRVGELLAEFENARRELAGANERVACTTAELTRADESLTKSAQLQEDMQRNQSVLARALEDRSTQAAQLDAELLSLRVQLAEKNAELAQNVERIVAVQEASDGRQAAAQALTRERDALAIRVTRICENTQSNEWKRNVWEGLWHELDSELTDARALLQQAETERANFVLVNDKMRAELTDRDARITCLEADAGFQKTALDELTALRLRDQDDHAGRMQEWQARGEALAAEVKLLEDRQRCSAELLAARDVQLDELRRANSTLEESARTQQTSNSAHALRVTELEGLAGDLSGALKMHTEIAARVNAELETRERVLAEERARAASLEAELQSALRRAADLSAAAQSSEAVLGLHVEQLSASQNRLADSERLMTSQSERIASLQTELADARALAEQAQATRRPLENELERARAELQREAERASELDNTQRKLALELERIRGALDERELQLRRLERYATSSAQVLGRIKVGIERGNGSAPSEPREFSATCATLVPLDDSNASPLTLGRRTTIGRAPENDLRLKDSSISRSHAVVIIGPNGAFIEDAHSVNGVRVNRKRVRHARLTDGDVIELGLKCFQFTTSMDGSVDDR